VAQFSTILGSYNQRNLTTYIGNKQQVRATTTLARWKGAS
jgi:hypothetical protein